MVLLPDMLEPLTTSTRRSPPMRDVVAHHAVLGQQRVSDGLGIDARARPRRTPGRGRPDARRRGWPASTGPPSRRSASSQRRTAGPECARQSSTAKRQVSESSSMNGSSDADEDVVARIEPLHQAVAGAPMRREGGSPSASSDARNSRQQRARETLALQAHQHLGEQAELVRRLLHRIDHAGHRHARAVQDKRTGDVSGEEEIAEYRGGPIRQGRKAEGADERSESGGDARGAQRGERGGSPAHRARGKQRLLFAPARRARPGPRRYARFRRAPRGPPADRRPRGVPRPPPAARGPLRAEPARRATGPACPRRCACGRCRRARKANPGRRCRGPARRGGRGRGSGRRRRRARPIPRRGGRALSRNTQRRGAAPPAGAPIAHGRSSGLQTRRWARRPRQSRGRGETAPARQLRRRRRR